VRIFPDILLLVSGLSWVVRAFDGTLVMLSESRWEHIVARHPELDGKKDLILEAVSNPDEVYVDARGAFHALKMTPDGVSDYIVVIYEVIAGTGKGFIRTAYFLSLKRKKRRYRWLRKLRVC